MQDAELSDDGRTLTLTVSDVAPCWQMSIRYRLQGRDGEVVEGEIQNTIHALNPDAAE